MWIDFAAAAVLIISIFRGDRRGLVRSFVGCFGWLISLIAGVILRPDLLRILDEHTGIRSALSDKIMYYAKLRLIEESGMAVDEETTSMIMGALRDNATSIYNTAAEKAAAPVVDMIMQMIAVVAVMVLIRFAFGLITMLFSLIADNNGPANFLNSVGGMAFGVVEAAFIIYLIAMFIIFVAIIGNFDILSDQISSSVCINMLERFHLIPHMDTLTALLAA